MSDFDQHSTPSLPERPSALRLATAFGAYALLMLAVLGGAEWIRRVATDAAIFFDFDNLLNINASGMRSLLGIGILPVAWFFGFQIVSHFVQKFNLPLTHRVGAMLAAAATTFAAGMILPAGAQDTLGMVTGFALVMVALFSIMTDENAPDFGWTAGALVLFSALAAWNLFSHVNQRDQEVRQQYAALLAEPRDADTAEPLLAKWQQTIQQDGRLPMLLQPWPFKPTADTIRNHLNRLAWQDKYLFQHYRLRVFAFDMQEDAPLLIDQGETRSHLSNIWQQAATIETSPEVKYTFAPDGAMRYIVHARVNRMQDASHPVDIYCYFDHIFPRQTQVYAQLFYDQPYKQLQRLANYDFAVVNQKQLVAEQGKVIPAVFNTPVESGKSRELTADNYSAAIAKSADGAHTAVVGKPSTTISKGIYLFAMLFTLSTAILFLFGWLTSLWKQLSFLPTTLGSLQRRIQYAVFALLVLGFLIVGWQTYDHFSQSAAKADQKQFNKNTEALLIQLRSAGNSLSPGSDSLYTTLSGELAQSAAGLNIDANLYNAAGSIVATTRDDLRRIGLLAANLNSEAKSGLSGANTSIELNETLNGRQFTSSYQAILNNRQQIIGYLGVPYRFNNRGVGPEVSTFIGMLAGIYVFLLLLGIGGTWLLARSIAKPVNEIAQKISALQLENKNEPLDYKGDQTDEIGALVNSYNQMVNQLEASKVQLVRLERESAWRDMARQIAHDIKNPLTTMKLSMQQLERVANDPEQAAAYLKRATSRLIEQIDSLAQTASEFSMFASLDMKNRAEVSLNDIVESVYDLFSEQKDADLSLTLSEERLAISADKNHLLRVLNNLVINAIQAIPSDRRGRVQVALYRDGAKAVVRISDNGGGIPAEIRDRVFEPNFTTKTTGSGLGLAICHKIIEAHDGTIRFETRDNEGTDFFVEIPTLN